MRNGKTRTIWILAGWLFAVCTGVSGTAFALTWKAVAENRTTINDFKDGIGSDIKEILQRVTRIEARTER